ncbi:hypothetical protein F441_03397, partial [Phytophthora nicotianae CJ01A1]
VATDSVPTDVNERQGMRAGRGNTFRDVVYIDRKHHVGMIDGS